MAFITESTGMNMITNSKPLIIFFTCTLVLSAFTIFFYVNYESVESFRPEKVFEELSDSQFTVPSRYSGAFYYCDEIKEATDLPSNVKDIIVQHGNDFAYLLTAEYNIQEIVFKDGYRHRGGRQLFIHYVPEIDAKRLSIYKLPVRYLQCKPPAWIKRPLQYNQ